MPSRGTAEPGAALARACAALKVFPLPDVVVLPGTPAPFHIFEPRYRALVGDALRGDRILAIATLVRPADAPQERAAVHPVAGAVRIEAEKRLPDGRYHVIVRGIGRVSLAEELEAGKPYRVFRAEPLRDVHPPGGEAALAGDVESVRQLVLELSQVLPPESGAARLAETVARLRDAGAIADLVAAATVSETGARLRVLGELDVARRLRAVQEEVASVLLVLAQGKTPRA